MGPVELAVLEDGTQQVFTICVNDKESPLCKSVAQLAQAVLWLERNAVELHDIGHLPKEEQLEIKQRRQHLKSQTSGWDLFEVVETRKRKLILAGSNKDKRKRAKTIALIAAMALDDGSKALTLTREAQVLESIGNVRHQWNNACEHGPHLRPSVRESVVEYMDTDGDKIEFKLEGGHMNYCVNGRLEVHHLMKLDGKGLTLHLDGTSSGKWKSARKYTVPAGQEAVMMRTKALYNTHTQVEDDPIVTKASVPAKEQQQELEQACVNQEEEQQRAATALAEEQRRVVEENSRPEKENLWPEEQCRAYQEPFAPPPPGQQARHPVKTDSQLPGDGDYIFNEHSEKPYWMRLEELLRALDENMQAA